MKKIVALVVTLVLGSTASGQSLCIATYNLNYGNTRGDQVLDAISKARPDLICFQETTEQSEQFLQESLARSYPHFYSVGHKGHYYAERFAFACKSALKDVRFTPPDSGLFGFYSATLTWDAEQIQVVNAHLTPFQFGRGHRMSDVMAAMTRTEEIHAKEMDVIVRSLDLKRPAIIVGDFNSMSTFVAPRRLVELELTDAFASVTPDPDMRPTWRWPTRPVPIALRIDYIFHSQHFRTTKSEILDREGSDHALLYANLERK